MSLIGTGEQYQKQAQAVFGDLQQMEAQRNQANKEMKTNEKASKMSMIGTGAGIGTAIMPGVGTAIGAAAGFLASELF